MKKGLLVTNTFLNTEKFSELTDMFTDAASKYDCSLEVKTGADLWSHIAKCDYRKSDDYDFVLFWDKDVKLAKELEDEGYRVLNPSEAIADCDDKAKTYLKLVHHNVLQPKTVCSPLKYFADGIVDNDYLDEAINNLGFPLVIKECFGSFGHQVYLAKDKEEAEKIITGIGEKPYILQEFIKDAAGRDARLQVVGGKTVAAMGRRNDNDFRANITNGGIMEKYVPSPEEERLAEKVCEILKLDFAGVDILTDKQGNKYICEVNSNAHFKNLYDCTGVNVAEEIIKYAMSDNI